MKLPRFRFTVRRMMIAVSVMALVVGIWCMKLRRDEYLARAQLLSALAKECRALEAQVHQSLAGHRMLAEMVDQGLKDGSLSRVEAERLRPSGSPAQLEAEIGRAAQDTERYERLRRKYDRAARYPWLPVAPDPPEPEE